MSGQTQSEQRRERPDPAGAGLNYAAIERALRAFQADIDRINAVLGSHLEPVEDGVIANMIDGYRLIEAWLAEGLDPFSPGRSEHLLDLNALVLCGPDPAARVAHQGHLAATRERFYSQQGGGGIGALVEWYKRNRGQEVWSLAAGLFLEIIHQPQLFVEGNHRTGVLLINYLLMRDGRAPFVLTPDNALPFFTLAAGAGHQRPVRLALLLGGGPRADLAHFLADHARDCERFRRQ